MKGSRIAFGIAVLALAACVSPAAQRGRPNDPVRVASERLQPKSPLFSAIRILHQSGARPRFSPDGTRFVFDRRNSDGLYDVYVSDLNGQILRAVTEGQSGVPQRNNGNARYDPSGRFIVFVSEEEEHFGKNIPGIGDPGIGLMSNFRATPAEGGAFWTLTDTPIKKNIFHGMKVMAVVNPVFSSDGRMFVWTERYDNGGNNDWGRWRIRAADFVVTDGRPSLRNDHVLYTPSQGDYATAMGFLDSGRLLFAGNPDGQHEYGMDQYVLEIGSKRLRRLTSTPEVWEEGSCIAPNGRIVYMTNIASRHKIDFDEADWFRQPTERDYYIMDADGGNQERITFFNDPDASEYLGGRAIVAACDVSPDGRYLAGTLGVDTSKGARAALVLKIILAEFRTPQR
jgi:Tol biopolymer transport system component